MTKRDFFFELAKSAITPESSDEEVLGCMVILHTHSFRIHPDIVLSDAGQATTLEGLTRRHVSEIVASVMRAVGLRDDPKYWHDEYVRRSPFEVFSDVPDTWMPILNLIFERMANSGYVVAFHPD